MNKKELTQVVKNILYNYQEAIFTIQDVCQEIEWLLEETFLVGYELGGEAAALDEYKPLQLATVWM